MPKTLEERLAAAEADNKAKTEANEKLTAENKTLAEENKQLKADAKAASDKHATDLKAEQDKAAAAEKREKEASARAEKAEADNKATADLLGTIGIKADASAADNHGALKAHTDKLASAKALEITSAQGSNQPLPVGATGNQGEAPKATGLERAKATFAKQISRA